MLHRTMHVFLGLSLTVLISAQVASAVSFGRMDVASHLGEPFYAEMPLELGMDESLAKTSVELGASADYRILEVYRNQILNAIRVDVVDDERGPRAVLSSEAAIDAAFFNVVLKIRYGRSTHFKKFPVLLEVANRGDSADVKSVPVKMAPPIASTTVNPESSNAFIAKAPEDLLYPNMDEEAGLDALLVDKAEEKTVEEQPAFESYDGWARTNRYGPMVFGDTITTVAKRLRLDDQFTNQQVMIALFEKNAAQFDKDNINLIKANTYLDVPTAKEVSSHSPAEAMQILRRQNQAWQQMQNQAKYAAVAQAQKTRYSSRVRMGQTPAPVAQTAMPVDMPANDEQARAIPTNDKVVKSLPQASSANSSLEHIIQEKDAALDAIRLQLAAMQQQLLDAEKRTKLLEEKAAAASSADAVALEAQNKRLEIVVSRLKNELEQNKTNVNNEQGAADWVVYAFGAMALLVFGLIAAMIMLLRRKTEHPATQEISEGYETSAVDIDFSEASVATKVMSADDFDLAMKDVKSETNPTEEDHSFDGFQDVNFAELEEIPELTSEDTGEIEAFNADQDEDPDPTVNYLEEADVYLRYGMEDEAEKQVRMALKLNNADPLAHAKMVQLKRNKGDNNAADELTTAAKALLAGAALATFESALAGDEVVNSDAVDFAEERSLSALSEPDPLMDTGLVDFGEVNFGAELSDEPSESAGLNVDGGDDFDFDFSDMATGLDADTNQPAKSDSESKISDDSGVLGSDGLDFDFGDLNLTSDDTSADEMDRGLSAEVSDIDDLNAKDSLNFGDLDFNIHDSAAGIEAEDNAFDFDEATTLVDSVQTESANQNVDEVNHEYLTGADAMDDSIGLESLDFSVEDLDISSLSSQQDEPVAKVLDTALEAEQEKIAEENIETPDVMDDSIGLESLDFNVQDFDMSLLSVDEDNAKEEESDPSDLQELSFDHDDAGSDFQILDFDLPDETLVESVDDEPVKAADFNLDDPGEGELATDLSLDGFDTNVDQAMENIAPVSGALNELDLNDRLDVQPLDEDFLMKEMKDSNDTLAASEAVLVETGDDVDWDDLTLDFSGLDMSLVNDMDKIIDDSNSETGDFDEDFDLDGTTLLSSSNDTMAIGLDDIDLSEDLNDHEVDMLAAQADKRAKDAVVDLDEAADDPFATANQMLDEADVEGFSDSGLDDELASLSGEKFDELSLDESVDKEDSGDTVAFDLGLEGLDMDEATDAGVENDTLEDFDLGSDFDSDMLSELDSDLNQLTEHEKTIVSNVNKVSSDDFQSTVILNNINADLKDIVEDDALTEADVPDEDPMADTFSATAELNMINDSMTDFSLDDKADPMVDNDAHASELDGLLNDLDGLLDEDDLKK